MAYATYAFECPNEECDFVALIDYVPPTRVDPGYLKEDPPEECPRCETDMTAVESEHADPNDFRDPDEDHYPGRWDR